MVHVDMAGCMWMQQGAAGCIWDSFGCGRGQVGVCGRGQVGVGGRGVYAGAVCAKPDMVALTARHANTTAYSL